MSIRNTALLLSLALALSACAKNPRASYLKTLDQWTDKLVIQESLGTALRLRGTYLSPTFRGVLEQERARLLGDADSDAAGFRERQAEAMANTHEIVFTAESDIESNTKFGDHDGAWRLRLVADGVEQPLLTVHRVRRPNSLQEALFAHKNLWNELWVARFDATVSQPTTLEFHVGSGYGSGSLQWSSTGIR
ncbi:MAG: hypothetical protein ACON5B_15415 [Myxococcota bacterium]